MIGGGRATEDGGTTRTHKSACARVYMLAWLPIFRGKSVAVPYGHVISWCLCADVGRNAARASVRIFLIDCALGHILVMSL